MEKHVRKENNYFFSFLKIGGRIVLTVVFLIAYLTFMTTIALGLIYLMKDKVIIEPKMAYFAFCVSGIGIFLIVLIQKLQFGCQNMIKELLNMAAGIITMGAAIVLFFLLVMDFNGELVWLVYPDMFLMIVNRLLMLVSK